MVSPVPGLGPQLREIERLLIEKTQLGILSITVLQREGRNVDDGWDDYDGTLTSIAAFLGKFLEAQMRCDDLLLAPLAAGNAYLVLLSPPRSERALDLIDLTRVRQRLDTGLSDYLSQSMPHSAVERFGVYVGGSLLHYDPQANCERSIYRSVDSAFADALNQKQAEVRRHSLQLMRILQTGDVSTVYQPVVDLQDRRVLGYEALTRVDPRHFHTPDLLFKAAHENRALWRLERLTRRNALENLPRLRDGQLLFLNIEPDSILDPELCGADFRQDLRRVGLCPARVVLEVTEHVAVTDFAAAREALRRFRSVGFRLAMDDVGSGYAGLRAIAELSPDFLKADMALVRDMHRHAIKRELITTIRRFTERTCSTLVAEGVERPEELQALAAAGVRCAQGYLLARPAAVPQEPDWNTVFSDPPPVSDSRGARPWSPSA